jgi:hypothetical protein|tara:strand:+ start:276 stop:566 length:291 start_codon:yes stop_codon:yes gene_type:complete
MDYNLKLNGRASFVTPPSYEITWEGRRWALDIGWRAITNFGTKKSLSFATVQLDKAKKDYALEPHKIRKNAFSVWTFHPKTASQLRGKTYNTGWKR